MASNEVALLVVEDDALILLATVDYFADEGFQVFEAANADIAMQELQNHPEIEVMFTDVDMPGSMNGIELSLAAHTIRPQLKIIITSGLVAPASEVLAYGFKFFPKPYIHHQIRQTIEQLIN
jgi:DNA-binding NtrC family response regulator